MPYQPKFAVSAQVVGELERIAVLRERILSATVQVPWMPSLQRDARVRNTHSSTAIEGNPLTLEQVRLIEEGHGLPAEPSRAKREVLNYLAGLRYVERHADKKRVTHRDVFTLHTTLADEVLDQGDAGRYRDIQVYVGRYTPPAATGPRVDGGAPGMVERAITLPGFDHGFSDHTLSYSRHPIQNFSHIFFRILQ